MRAAFPDAHITGAELTAFLNATDHTIEDPWLGAKAGGQFLDSASNPLANQDMQPFPFTCPVSTDPRCTDIDHSNHFQNRGFTSIPCPELDYNFWRQVAISGTNNA